MSTPSFLIQVLLPLYDNEGTAFDAQSFSRTRAELVAKFGGLTAHLRAPARGLWKTEDGAIERDDVAIFEVMARTMDEAWWAAYRKTLEERFRQDVVLVRAIATTML